MIRRKFLPLFIVLVLVFLVPAQAFAWTTSSAWIVSSAITTSEAITTSTAATSPATIPDAALLGMAFLFAGLIFSNRKRD